MILVFCVLISVFCGLNETLRDAALKAGVYIGAAGNSFHITQNLKYKEVLSQQYDLITPENACKWAATQPKQKTFDFKACDVVYDFAAESEAKFRGHNLCWGNGNPKWLLEGHFTPSEKKDILINHIETVVGKYKGKAYAWDVVNEAVSDNGKGLKDNIWYPDVPDYIDVAFNTSRKIDPTVKLFYNDYSAEDINKKSDYIYSMVKGMIERKIPIDGVGFQMHISSKYSPKPSNFEENLKRFTDLGLIVQITEMDIRMPDPCDEKCLNQQAELYATYLRICLNNHLCTNFETWGFSDLYSWLGEKVHPLPFDEDFNPKPAAFSILKELKEGRK